MINCQSKRKALNVTRIGRGRRWTTNLKTSVQRFSGWLSKLVMRMLENLKLPGPRAPLNFKTVKAGPRAMRLASSFSRGNFKIMPIAYSTDLRWRAVWLHIAHSERDLQAAFSIREVSQEVY